VTTTNRAQCRYSSLVSYIYVYTSSYYLQGGSSFLVPYELLRGGLTDPADQQLRRHQLAGVKNSLGWLRGERNQFWGFFFSGFSSPPPPGEGKAFLEPWPGMAPAPPHRKVQPVLLLLYY
jgi:hypothetical protein